MAGQPAPWQLHPGPAREQQDNIPPDTESINEMNAAIHRFNDEACGALNMAIHAGQEDNPAVRSCMEMLGSVRTSLESVIITVQQVINMAPGTPPQYGMDELADMELAGAMQPAEFGQPEEDIQQDDPLDPGQPAEAPGSLLTLFQSGQWG